MAAGNDKKVTFYDTYGNILQRFDYTHEEKVKDFSVATACRINMDCAVPSGFFGEVNLLLSFQFHRVKWKSLITTFDEM